MINNTSWAGYWYAIILLYTIYYLVAGSCYYKNELAALLIRKKAFNRNENNPTETLTLYMQSIIDEVIAFCAQAAADKYSGAEVLHELKILLQKHASIKGSADAGVLNRVIGAELEKGCSIRLSMEELEMLWVV